MLSCRTVVVCIIEIEKMGFLHPFKKCTIVRNKEAIHLLTCLGLSFKLDIPFCWY
uniref:Uncharacterized protein n=1 Tax=Kalanchoe fedtschenkoi TaxID=63787 RepID=A0A7N0U2L3_KALFE